MSRTLAAIVGGAAGAMTLVGIVLLLLWLCIRQKKSDSRTSETGSSDPSLQVGRNVGIELSLRDARRFSMEELSVATKNFTDKNLIGAGKFGEVYKGLLNDGMLVAIKRRRGPATQEFIDEVRYLSSIQHRNIVVLLGYCQENNQQFLIYEYIPNGSLSGHLYAINHASQTKLEFKLRLSIALGAAKGIRNFLGRSDIAGSSSQQEADEIFLAPEVKEFRRFSEKSDVYSFGVFILELVSGREAMQPVLPDSNQNLVELVQNHQGENDVSIIIDQRLGNSFTAEGVVEFVQLLVRCLDLSSERRPSMSYVVTEIDRIYEKEMSLTVVMGENPPTVTLGSQLFKASQ